jgi:hypothetical protein
LDYLCNHYAEMVFMQQFKNSSYVAKINTSNNREKLYASFGFAGQGEKELLLRDMDSMMVAAFRHGTLNELSAFLKNQPKSTLDQNAELICKIC